MDFSSTESASGEILNYHRNISNFTLDELSKTSSISIDSLKSFEHGSKLPSISDLKKLANALTINVRDLLPNDKTEDKVIVKFHDEGKTWFYPENSDSYEFHELATTSALPFSKSFENWDGALKHCSSYNKKEIFDKRSKISPFWYKVTRYEFDLYLSYL